MSLIIQSNTIIKGQTIIGQPIITLSGLLLDTYNIVGAAYSLRKLRTAYTGYAIRVRRSSDNTTQDIGFNSNGVLDTAALLSFVGAGNGTVTIWYDQSGNGYNAVPFLTIGTPDIVSAGTIYTLNGKPSLYFNGNKTLISSIVAPNSIATSGTFSMFGVGSANDTATRLFLYIGGGTGHCQIRRSGNILQCIPNQNGGWTDAGNVNIGTTQFITSVERKMTSSEIFTNNSTNGGTSAGAPVYNNPVLVIGSFDPSGPSFAWNGHMQEMITFPIDPSTVTNYRAGVTTNLNSYYGTY